MIQRYIGACGSRAVQGFFMALLVGATGVPAARAETATYTGPGSDFGTAANWGGVTPGPTQDLLVNQNATLIVSGSQQARNLDVIAGTTGITLNTGSALVLNSLENGTLSVDIGAVLGITGAGTLQAAVIETGGTLNLATTTTLDGGANPNPSRDGSSPSAVTRYGLVVLGGGTATLQSGANVTLAKTGKVVGMRVGEGAGTGTLAVQAGSNLTVGTATDRGFVVVGDFGSTGVVNQTGGTVSVVGAVNVGSQGGTGTYNLSGGTFNVGLFEDGSDSNGFSVGARRTGANAAPNGTLNISGTGELILTRGYLLVGGDTSPTSGGTGVVNQTGGLVRIIKDGLALGSGASGTANGTYNLNGGVLELGGINGIQAGGSGGGSYAFNFGGGTLRVIGSDLTTSISANLAAGTVSTIDTNGLNATWSGNLMAAGLHQIDFGGSALVKTGTGTLTLGGTSGTTRVLDTFAVTGGTVVQTAGTTSSVEFMTGSGVGSTAIYTLSGGALEINASTKLVGGVAVAGSFRVGDFGGTGTFNQSGGTVTLANSSALNIGNQGGSGTYNLSGGTLTLNNGLHVIGRSDAVKPASQGALNLSGTGALLVRNGGSLFLGNNVSNPNSGFSGTLTQTGGTLSFATGTHFYLSAYTTGVYNLNGGTLEIGGASFKSTYNGQGDGGTFNFGGGTIKVLGTSLVTDVGVNLVDGTTSTINTNGLDATFSSDFGGTGAFEKIGEGTMILSGTSGIGKVTAGTWVPTVSTVKEGTLAVTGSTTALGILAANGVETEFGTPKTATISLANGGSLKIGNSASPGSYLLVGYGGGKTGAFSMTGGTLTVAGVADAPFPGSGIAVGDNGGSGRFSMSGGTINLGDGENITNLSIGTSGGTGAFTQSGGTVNLGTNFSVGAGLGSTGTYTLSGGAILNALPSTVSTIVYIGDNGGTGTLEIGGSAEVNFGAGSSLWIGGIGSAANSGSTGTVTQTGGTVNFGGNYFQLGGKAGDTGTYNLNGGTLSIGGANGIRSGNGTANFNLGGGILKVNGSDLTTTVRANLGNGTVSTINTNGFNATFANGFAGTGGFAKTGVGALTLNGTTSLQAASSVRGVLKVGAGTGKTGTLNLSNALTVQVTTAVGRLQIGVDGGTGTANFTNGASFVIDDTAAAGGWGTLDIGRGAGSTGVLNHSAGAVDVSGGALQIGYSGGTGTYHLSGNATLEMGDQSSLFIGSGDGASGLLTIADNAAFTSDYQVFVGAGAGATGTITQSGGSVAFTGTTVWFGTNSDETITTQGTGIYNLQAGTLLFEGVSQGVRFGDSAGGTGEFNQSGGTVTLTNTTLRVGSHGSYNQSGGVIEVGGTNLTGTGAYRFGGGTIKVVGSALTTGLNATLTTGKILTVDTNGFGATFSGAFTGAGGLTKTGEGVLRLTGTSNYSGATTISNGTFRVDGVLSGTTITVGSGATLAGHGTVAHVNILNGGRVDLGDTTGVLNATGDFSLGDTSHLLLKIASAADYDKITIGGGLTSGGTFEVVFINGFNPLGEASFSLLVAQSYDGAFDTLVLPDLAAGLEWNLDAMNSAGVLSIVGTAIPEPSTWAGLAGAAALALAVWRRRNEIRRSP